MPIKRFCAELALAMLAITILSGCANDNETPLNHSAASAVSVTDFEGNLIRLSSPAQRVVALAPHIVENVFSAGAGANLVGVVSYSNYPEVAKSLPIVGGYETTNQERIIELNPDLIIAWHSGNPNSSVERLKELGYTVYIDQPDNISDVAKSIRDIGVLTGKQQIANDVAQKFLDKLEVVTKEFKNAEKVTSFYQVWNKPLQTISGNHIISDAIEICGGINIYADEIPIAPVINIESVLERDPAAIIASGMSSARPEWLNEWKQWSSLTAVKHNNLFFVDPDHIQRHTLRLLQGIESICSQLQLARERRASR